MFPTVRNRPNSGHSSHKKPAVKRVLDAGLLKAVMLFYAASIQAVQVLNQTTRQQLELEQQMLLV